MVSKGELMGSVNVIKVYQIGSHVAEMFMQGLEIRFATDLSANFPPQDAHLAFLADHGCTLAVEESGIFVRTWFVWGPKGGSSWVLT